jgi:hypothetical protein
MRKGLVLLSVLALSVVAIGSIATTAVPAMADNDDSFRARLSGYNEVPSISTTGRGQFKVRLINPTTLQYELQYSNLEGIAPVVVTAAHIRFAQRGVNGGILADLCGGTKPVCPPSGAVPVTVTGTIVAADVLPIPGQGIAAGEFAELLRALNAGATYVNVQTATYPGGEIRGQVGERD